MQKEIEETLIQETDLETILVEEMVADHTTTEIQTEATLAQTLEKEDLEVNIKI